MNGNTITLTYSEELEAIDTSASTTFSVQVNGSARSVSQVNGSGNTVLLTFNGSPVTPSDTVTLSYYGSANPIKDLSGNAAASFSGFSIQNGIDTTAPLLQNGSAAGNSITLVYNEALNPAAVPSPVAYTILVNGAGRAVSAVTVSGPLVNLLLPSAISAADMVVVSYTGGVLSDLSGNAAAAFSARQIYADGSTGAIVNTGQPALYGIFAGGSAITLTFSALLDSSYTPSSTQFAVKINQGASPVSAVTVSGTTVRLDLYTAVQPGDTVTVSYSPDGIPLRSVAGLEAPPFTDVTAANRTAGAGGASDNGVSAADGVEIGADGVSAVPDISPAGSTANRYQITSDKLYTAFDTARASGAAPKAVFTVPDGENAGLAAFTLGTLQEIQHASPDASLKVVYKDASYELPLKALDYTQLGQMMNAAGPVGQLLVSIDTNAIGSGSGSLTAALNGIPAQLLTQPVSFELAVSSNGVTKPIDHLNAYSTRTIRSETAVDPRQTAVVWFDPQAGRLSYVPTHVQQSGSESVITFQRNGNSVYAAVKGSVDYADIGSHWARNDLLLLANKFIVEGRSPGRFEPDKTITRAEFASFIVRGLGLSGNVQAAAKFSDVDASSTAAASIGAAVNAGIVQGMPDGTFKPASPITREQMASMIVRASAAAGKSLGSSQRDADLLKRFKDAAKIGAWARGDTAEAVDAEIINGLTSDTFAPKSNATRAQAAVMIKRLLSKLQFLDE
ncbi:S-layer homology domain-containing protein [Paenibacillus humicola]|uniref:S-layer homology domain-containing protein n=1 Tax=Paenibacillus humicola TaxID=3110540 RepID=UPI00237B5D64|nr:SwmB domain-containing protein [Paenibacillus humicola]